MKRILTFVLALAMALSLAACGGKADDNNGKTDVDMTAQQIMDTLKEKLGDSFDCDVTEDETRMSGYWGFDMDKIEDWAAMSNSNSSLNPSTAVIVKVKDGYAQDAADEAAKVDDVWSGIFGSADNSIVIPEDDGNSGFNMEGDFEGLDGEPVIGG